MGRFISTDEAFAIVEAFKQGKSTTDICEEFGRGRKAIIRVLKDAGVFEVRPKANQKLSDSLKSEIVAKFNSGKLAKDIANALKLDPRTVSKALHEAGIDPRVKACRPTYVESTYGIASAGDRCDICGSRNKLVIDHNHLTGEIRGTLCNRCNLGIGKLQDSKYLAQRAVEYLSSEPADVEDEPDSGEPSDLVSRYVSGESMESLAKDAGCAVGTIRRLLVKSKVDIRPRGPKSHKFRVRSNTYSCCPSKLERLLDYQDHKCAICLNVLDKSAHVDHDHSNGRVRGWLCSPCNQGIGLLRDDVGVAKRVVDYLGEDHLPVIPVTIPDPVPTGGDSGCTGILPDESKDGANNRQVYLSGQAMRYAGARQCDITIVSHADAREFYSRFHLQGPPGRLGITIGLAYDGLLVAAMSFNSPAVCRASGSCMLQRFATSGSVPGAASRLLSTYRKFRRDSIVTFSDPRYTDGGIYEKLGFAKVAEHRDDYVYMRDGKVYRKNRCQKKHLRCECDTAGIQWLDSETERELAIKLGYSRVTVPGKVKWELANNS